KRRSCRRGAAVWSSFPASGRRQRHDAACGLAHLAKPQAAKSPYRPGAGTGGGGSMIGVPLPIGCPPACGSGADTSLRLRLGVEITGGDSTDGIGADKRVLGPVLVSELLGTPTLGVETGMPEVALRCGFRSILEGAALPLQADGFVGCRSLTDGTLGWYGDVPGVPPLPTVAEPGGV